MNSRTQVAVLCASFIQTCDLRDSLNCSFPSAPVYAAQEAVQRNSNCKDYGKIVKYPLLSLEAVAVICAFGQNTDLGGQLRRLF